MPTRGTEVPAGPDWHDGFRQLGDDRFAKLGPGIPRSPKMPDGDNRNGFAETEFTRT